MRLASVARRSVATLAVASLISAGGLVTGASVGVAFAADFPITVSPSGVVNDGVKTFTVTAAAGSPEFFPSKQESVVVRRNPPVAGQGDIAGAVQDNSASCTPATAPLPPVPDSSCGRSLTFTADMTNVAPGNYDVIVTATSTTGTANTYTRTNAIGVAVNGSPTVTDSKLFAASTTQPPDGSIEITGTNLTKGSTVDFLLPSGAPDTGLSFVVTSYVSATTLRGTYTQGAFTVGVHFIRVTNPIGQSGVSTKPFYQPRINSIAPSQFGQGASSAPLTITGDGFNPSSTLFIKAPATPAPGTGPSPGIGTGDVIVAPDLKTLSTTISVGSSVTPGARDLTVRGSDGGFVKVVDGLLITAAPRVTSVAPNPRGQGFIGDVTVTGTGLNAGTAFDFGPGITAVTKSSSGGTTAIVTLTIAPDAALGGHSIVATNPDYGTSTLAGGFTVTARPVITSISPPSALRGETKTVDVIGMNFVSGADLNASPAGLTITKPVTFVSSTLLRATFRVEPTTDPKTSAFDISVTNPDGGTSTCAQCFGINTLSVLTTPVTNAGTVNVTVQAPGLTDKSVVTVSLPSAADQGTLTGSFVAFDPTTGRLTVSLPLGKAAAGLYNVTATTPGSGTLSCVGCLNVLASVNPSNLVVTPNTGGAGATNRVIEITGDGLSRGQTVSFGSGVTTVSTTYNGGANSLRVVINVNAAATPGARDVTVTNIGQPGSRGTLVGGFTVNAAPITATISPDSVGQGATLDITLTGTDYQDGATVDLGPGVTTVIKTLTSTEIVVTATIAPDADTTAKRNLVVVNPDGGTSTNTGILTITVKPVVTSVEPSTAKVGDTLTGVVFNGTGFASQTSGEGDAITVTPPTITIANVTVSNVVVVDSTKITADLQVSATAPVGRRTVFITNPDGGTSSTPGAFAIANVPVAPTNVAVTAGNTSATVTWDFPTAPDSDGGSALTGFVVDDGDSTTDNAKTVAPNVRTATLTGLTNGKTYTFSVRAVNALGAGPAGTATGTPFGVPLPPTSVTATPGDGRATVSWSGADAQGESIDFYTVRTSNGTTATETEVPGSQTSAVITGLTNGVTYTFTVKAKNAAGYGAYSTATGTATPRATSSTSLTSTRSPATIVAGSTVTYSGRLTRADGTPVPGAAISVTLTPDIGTSRVVATTTNSNGVWAFTFRPGYNTTVRARFAGNASDDASSAAAFKMGVSPRITRTAPANGATSSAGSTLSVKGAIAPNKVGRTMGLYSGSTLIGKGVVGSNGYFTINARLPRGTYTLHIGIGVTPGNIGGSSTNFIVRRV